MNDEKKTLVEIIEAMYTSMSIIDDAEGEFTPTVEAALEDLEGWEGEASDKLDKLVLVLNSYKGLAEELKKREDEIKRQKTAAKNAAERVKGYMTHCVDILGGRVKTEKNEFKIVKTAGSIEVESEAMVDKRFVEVVETIKIDKKEIRKAIKEEGHVVGARLVPGFRLKF